MAEVASADATSVLFSRSYAGGYPKGGGNGGEYGNEDVEDFSPEVFVCIHKC